MEHIFLNTLQDRMTFESIYQVTEVIVRETRGAQPPRPYWDLNIRDSSGSRLARVWAPRSLTTEQARDYMTLTAPCFIKAKLKTETYNGDLRLVVEAFEVATDVDMSVFMKVSGRLETDEKLMLGMIEAIKHPLLKQLLCDVFAQYKDALAAIPAAENGRYAAIGGALAQTVDIACLVSTLSVNNKDKEIVTEIAMTAALLVNVGKCMTFEQKDGLWSLNTTGRLFGNSLPAYEVISAYMVSLNVETKESAELLRRVLHAVAAAHWAGAQPQSYEAVLVRHALDMTDAAAHVDNLASASGSGDFTAFDSTTKRCYLRTPNG